MVALLHQRHDGGRRFLDGTAGHVDHRPVMLGTQPAHEADFFRNRGAVDIAFVLADRIERQEPVLADLQNPFGTRDQADDERTADLIEFRRYRDLRDDRNVRCLDAAIGEVDARRGLRGPADADEHDIRLVQAFGHLPVVVHHRVVEGVDAPEIIGIERMLAADPARFLNLQVRLEDGEDRIENIHARHAMVPADAFQPVDLIVSDEGIENDTRSGFDLGQDAVELPVGTDKRIDVFYRLDVLVLGERGARNGHQRLAGGIRNQVQMEEATRIIHDLIPR